MSTETINLTSNKPLIIGRAWNNTRDVENPNMPAVTLRMDQNLGLNITLGAGSQILLFKNTKREGINPATQQPFNDPDFQVAISVPADVADREIARQKQVREATPVTSAPIDPVAA